MPREEAELLYPALPWSSYKPAYRLLITATGVGPKLAQAALAVLSPDQLRQAVRGQRREPLARPTRGTLCRAHGGDDVRALRSGRG